MLKFSTETYACKLEPKAGADTEHDMVCPLDCEILSETPAKAGTENTCGSLKDKLSDQKTGAMSVRTSAACQKTGTEWIACRAA